MTSAWRGLSGDESPWDKLSAAMQSEGVYDPKHIKPGFLSRLFHGSRAQRNLDGSTGTILWFGAFSPDKVQPWGEVVSIYVDPTQRGRGISAKLFKDVLNLEKVARVPGKFLLTANPIVFRRAQANGFEEVRGPILPNGEDLAVWANQLKIKDRVPACLLEGRPVTEEGARRLLVRWSH